MPRQEAKPPGKTSELHQDRRQNHQERHQSCPFWDMDGATSVIFPAKGETLQNQILTSDLRNRFLTAKTVPQVTCQNWVLKRLDLCWLKTTSVISPKSGWECPHRWRNSPGVAPSMSQKGSLMLRKKMGGNQGSPNFSLGFAPENGPHQVSSFLWETQEKALFRGTWWGPFSGAEQSGKLPERRRLQKICHF